MAYVLRITLESLLNVGTSELPLSQAYSAEISRTPAVRLRHDQAVRSQYAHNPQLLY